MTGSIQEKNQETYSVDSLEHKYNSSPSASIEHEEKPSKSLNSDGVLILVIIRQKFSI